MNKVLESVDKLTSLYAQSYILNYFFEFVEKSFGLNEKNKEVFLDEFERETSRIFIRIKSEISQNEEVVKEHGNNKAKDFINIIKGHAQNGYMSVDTVIKETIESDAAGEATPLFKTLIQIEEILEKLSKKYNLS